jgi:hypothetical protein
VPLYARVYRGLVDSTRHDFEIPPATSHVVASANVLLQIDGITPVDYSEVPRVSIAAPLIQLFQ